MKFFSYIMIHCIGPSDIDIPQLSNTIENSIKNVFSNSSVTLKTNIPYWKDPSLKSIIYNISREQNLTVSDLLSLFPLSWSYSKGHAFNVEIQQRVETESAVWSQLCHPEEIFLNSLVDWIHIYTLETIEKY